MKRKRKSLRYPPTDEEKKAALEKKRPEIMAAVRDGILF
jgi:hypothetical protein